MNGPLGDGIGYLKLVEAWGSDKSIVEAARMSTDKGFLGWGPKVCRYCSLPDSHEVFVRGNGCIKCESGHVHGDEKLLRYLYENKHATPFEMAGLIVEVQAPIFVFREWHRHRTQSFNELSARYTPLPDKNYIPSIERLMMDGGANKQATSTTGAPKLTESMAKGFQVQLKSSYAESETLYQWALNSGVPKELARVHLPVGRYSRMRASANLRNWLGFLTLRMDPKAQWEIRQYADAIGEIVAKAFPRTWDLFAAGRSMPEKEGGA